jgi:hypothetical protein
MKFIGALNISHTFSIKSLLLNDCAIHLAAAAAARVFWFHLGFFTFLD